VNYLLGGATGPTSHNNPQWVTEVNRLAPLLGFSDIQAGRQVAKRVPIGGKLTVTGKPRTTVKRVTEGNIPFSAVSGFPRALRLHLNTAEEYYTSGELPLDF
jgi:hypothetical protein